jgi:peroxisomal membrane protein 4
MHNGFTYGAKVRFTHSLVIAILFSKEPVRARIKRIFSNTLEHASKLAFFVLIYKSVICFLTRIRQVSSPVHSFFAAVIGSFLIFDKDNSLNSQIALYLFSRVLVGLTRLFNKKALFNFPTLQKNWVGLLAVYGFASSIYFMDKDISVLQHSLASSLKFIYLSSNSWHSWKDTLKSTLLNLIRT